jgi:hypothetical protein
MPPNDCTDTRSQEALYHDTLISNHALLPSTPGAEEEARREIAVRLECENTLWMVLYGGYSREFVCFPKFIAPQAGYVG